MKNYLLLLVLLTVCHSYGQTVNSIAELQTAVSASNPGEIIELADGTYPDDFILDISRSGTLGNPITIKAKNLGKVLFSGSAGINLNASYIKLAGFDFNGGSINPSNENTVILIKKGDNIVEDIRMINISNGSVAKHRYIYFRYAASKNCTVRRCWLESQGSENDGIKIFGNIRDGGTGSSNLVENCYFKSDLGVGNGSSAIRFGSGLRAQNLNGSNIIRNNLFFEYDGEDEIISLKSANNIVEGNTFLNCHGSLSCRHYNNNTIQDNYFINTDDALPFGVDLRIWGEDHQILNNYFYQTKPRESDGGVISLTAGSGDQDSSLHERVNKVTINNNIIYQTNNNYNAIAFGTNYGNNDSQGNVKDIIPSNISVSGNYIYENTGQAQIGYFGGTPTVTYSSNKVFQNVGITPVSEGISAVDPNLVPKSKNGYTIYSAPGKGPAVDPLNSTDVGPSWDTTTTPPSTESLPILQDFENGLDDWTQVSVSGNSLWSQQDYNSNAYAEFKGQKETNEDWLISPQIDLTTTNTIQMSFDLQHRYGTSNSNQLQLLISTNYNGDVASANWTALSFDMPTPSASWNDPYSSIDLNLDAYRDQEVTIAYKATADGTSNATRNWRIDNIQLSDLSSLPHSQDFKGGSLADWTSVQVSGGSSVWEYRSDINYGRYAHISSNKDYGSATENWLVSPALDMETMDDVKLTFQSAFRYGTSNSNEMSLWATTSYTGDVTTTQWTELDYIEPTTADLQRYSSGDINLNPYRIAGARIAFKATSDGSSNATRNFSVDDILIGTSTTSSCFETTGDEEGWARIGDVTINPVTDDGDNGDSENDGALAVVSLSSGANEEQGAFYTFDCSMVADETLQVESVLFNTRNSYVAADMQLYNSTDDVVLATTGRMVVPANGTTPMALSYVTQVSDDGDQLQLRYLRSDDGNPVRSFSIDYAMINGAFLNMLIVEPPLNPACANGVDVDPDIALSPVTAQQVAEAEKVYQTLSDTYLGTVAPSNFQDQMDRALLDYEKLEITVNGNLVNGKETTFKYAGSIIKTFAKYLKLVDPNDTVIAEKASNLVALVSQQFCKGTILLDSNAYDFEDFSRPTIYLKDYLSDAVKDQYGYVLDAQTRNFHRFWGADFQEGQEYNTDWMFNMSEQMILYGTFRYPDNDEEKVRYMKAGKRFLERFLTYSDGTGDGLKPDGTGFHHWFAYDGYMYALTTVINNVDAFNDTEFQIDAEYYHVLRNAIYAQKMFSNDAQIKALSMSGRNPQIRKVSTGKSELSKLAISGGKILNLSTADPLLAGYYNRVWGNNPEFNYSMSTAFEEGFIQLNHAQAGVYRKDNWVAVMKGFGDALPGSELYPTTNRYGRYQSYGTLEILYPGGIAQGENGYDVETWDWNYNPGATTIVLPWEELQGERSRIDEVQQKSFVGSLAFKNKGETIGVLEKNYGTYGLFAMDFQELENQGFGTVYGPNTHNATFTFKKSNFAFDDFIVSLGSGISNNDVDNPTVTTLYQRTADAQSGVTVNSSFYGNGENSFVGTKDNWLISDYNTGFYVVSGSGDLKIRKGDQQTPNYNQIDPNVYHDNKIGTYTRGYIDHGNAPADAGYEYVIKPNATSSDMQAIEAEKPYIVLEKSAERHIVKHKEDEIWGYALFEPSTDIDSEKGFIKANDAKCLVMYQKLGKKDEHILLSMTNPDLGFEARSNQPAVTRNIQLTLRHNWSLSEPNSQVSKVSQTDSTTTFQFTVQQAMLVEVDLAKTKAVKKVHITPAATQHLEVGETYEFRGFATPAKATDVSLVWSSDNEAVATVDQEGTVSGKSSGNATISCTDEGTGKFDTVEVVVGSSKKDDKPKKSKDTFIIYPNPTTSFLTAHTKKHITSFVIYGYLGNVRLSEFNLKSKELVIQVGTLQAGVYILQVTDKKGNTQSEKFIKK